MSEVKKIKLKSVAKNKKMKGKTFKMVESGGKYVPRDCTFDLNSGIFVFDLDAGTIVI